MEQNSSGSVVSSQRDIKIKVCGITTVKDAHLVAEAGADYIGVIIDIDFSPRRLTIEEARPICEQSTLLVVALFFNREAEQIQRATAALNPHAVQLLGQENPLLVKRLKNTMNCQVWKSIHLPPWDVGDVSIAEQQEMANSMVDAGIDATVIDTVVSSSEGQVRYGGTGQVNNWAAARRLLKAIPVRTFLAGGINPENVQQAIELVHPYGIDLCSGVEAAPGKKDPVKVRQLVLAVREATLRSS